VQRFSYTLKWGSPLFFRSPDEDGEETADNESANNQDDILTQINAAIGAQNKKLFNKFSSMIDEVKKESVKKSDLDALLKKQPTGSPAEPSPAPTPEPTESNDEPSSHPDLDGLKVRLESMNTRMSAMEEENSTLKDQVAAKEQEAKLRDRDMKVLKVCESRGVKHSDQVLKLIQNDLTEVDEKGWMAKVQTDFGDDVQPIDEYIDGWLEKNPHMVGTRKSGSGSSGGDSVEGSFKVRPEDLTPENYEKNREKIISKLESERGLNKS